MNTFYKFTAGALVIFCIWCIYIFFSPARHTEVVSYGTLEDSVSVSAYIIKDEALIKAKTAGVPSFLYSEGARVARGREIAVIHSGEMDPLAYKKLARIDERIASVKEAAGGGLFAADEQRINSELEANVGNLVIMASSRSIGRIADVKNNINRLLDKRELIKGSGAEGVLSELKGERAALAAQLGAAREVLIAPAAGVFSSAVDGLENLLTVAGADKLTVKDMEKISAVKPPEGGAAPGEAVCKIIDNFSWRIAAAAPKAEIGSLSAGDSVNIRLPDLSAQILPARVCSVSDEEGAESVIVLSCDQYVGDAVSKRETGLDIIKSKKTGLRVPLSAIRVSEGETGAYVEKGSDVVFKPLKILCSANGYAIVKEDNTGKNALLLYDKVIIKDKDIR